MNICTNCRTTLKPNARFCHLCGFQNSTSFTSLPEFNNYDKPRNRQFIYAMIWLFITVSSLISALLPFLIDIDMMQGGGAMIFIGFVMFITGAIVTPFFFIRASKFNKIVSGKNILAYWTYQADQWNEYSENELKKRRKEKWTLFWFISAIGLVVNIALGFALPDGIAIFICVQLGLMVIIGIAAYLSYRIPYSKNKKHIGKAIIAPYGIYLNGNFHSWQGLSARLELVQFGDNNTILRFVYSAVVRYGERDNYTVNVPVPLNEEATAMRIVEYFSRQVKDRNNK